MKKILICLLLMVVLINKNMAAPLNLSNTPLFLSQEAPPLTMLIIGKDHKLFLEAYNDHQDINEDGDIEIQFTPAIDYYGYFDNYKCYSYNGTYFTPISLSNNKTCTNAWSGNFLNYLTTSRMDVVRKVLYGGKRSTDTESLTLLERSFIPQEGHSWGKDYSSTLINGFDISQYTPFSQPTNGTHHLFINISPLGTTTPLLRVLLNQNERIWNWAGIKPPIGGSTILNSNTGLRESVTPIDFNVRVEVCSLVIGLESNCRLYPNGDYKPIGLLQEFGENGAMYFGLMTGSYVKNLAGGVVRRELGPLINNTDSNIKDELNPLNGLILQGGIIDTLNSLSIIDFNNQYNYSNCNESYNLPLVDNNRCRNIGNPISEMMYETLRYFSGKKSPSPTYDYSSTDAISTLPKQNSWIDPYATYLRCSKANMIVISDTSPTYDYKNIPGSVFSAYSGDLALNVGELANVIFSGENFGTTINAFIGEVLGGLRDGAPTPKLISGFANILGLSPEESNSKSSFYSSAVAYWGWITDLNSVLGTQNVKTFVLANTDIEPKISFNIGGKWVHITPFARTLRVLKPTLDTPAISLNPGDYQPVGSIIDFYPISYSKTGGVFRVHFHDSQIGGDFATDAVVTYTVEINGQQIKVTTEAIPFDTKTLLHLGYLITGTTEDGLYLTIRNTTQNTTDSNYVTEVDLENNDIPYFLDTGGTPLSILSTKTFISGESNLSVLNSPLWYAAKWGGFNDLNQNQQPDLKEEYASSLTSTPDNYFSLTNALNLRERITKMFQLLVERMGSFSSAALNSGYLAEDTRIYQALFNTKDWSGKLLSYQIDPTTGQILRNGSGPLGSLWDASEKINALTRHILSYNPTVKKGIAFHWTNLSVEQQKSLNTEPNTFTQDNQGPLRLSYLRGDQSHEKALGGNFRTRNTLLGDIINSNPITVGSPSQNYPMLWSSGFPENLVSYSTFKMNQLNRQPVLYVGANDGMLHAFDAMTGVELFSFIPSSIYSKISDLTSLNYAHRFYVDGPPTIADVFFANNWHTLLVGGLNGGGQGIYALEITNPQQFSENNAQSIVKWEFTDSNDKDLGYTYSQPQIARLNNGRWAAIFGNGFNNTATDSNVSTTGNAVLYIVDIETGALIKKFDTGVGMAQDPLLAPQTSKKNINVGRPNGLATPTIVDMDNNSIADFIYVGDLFGNLWKIDISSTNPVNWDFSFKTAGKPAPLFIAKDSLGNPQPITTKPTVSRVNFTGTGLQIYFGTGKYLENSDKTDRSIQTIYALRDNNFIITGRTNLLQQTITQETSGFRAVSNSLLANNHQGWYMDLIYNNNIQGERIVSPIIFLNGKLIFSTIIPNEDPCVYGGSSWLMEVNAASGARLNYNVFDLNHDGLFTQADSATSSGAFKDLTISGQLLSVGLVSTPAILHAGSVEYKYLPGTSGDIQTITESPGIRNFGRQSWRQLQ